MNIDPTLKAQGPNPAMPLVIITAAAFLAMFSAFVAVPWIETTIHNATQAQTGQAFH